ncbi:MAG: hypothetical protein KatS3mg029_0431 [Saprospiraceae bacterium]|nr:MAG: hypothetical protein KatS3mg029_0431 [Saprospiraceae bacterium]
MRKSLPIFVSLVFGLLLSWQAPAQLQENLSWRKHAKLAETLYNSGQYAEAGEHYRAAWKKKTRKTELIYKAGECFFAVRDYANAVDCWQHVKGETDKWPLIGLQYARALKQNGQYEEASNELVNFIGNYKGEDKGLMNVIVQKELRGCELAAQFASKGPDPNILIENPGPNINTPETEFAPFPYGDDVLYFSSTMGSRAEIYRSVRSQGEWTRAKTLENFPTIERDHFCNGSLAPDAQRFYFTICKAEETWGGLTSRCQIYVTRRVGNTWAAPEKLPDYINEPGVTTTHPFVVHDGNTEILYFASNRSGGNGSMDIWYTTRQLSSNANDFSLPINAGSIINTSADEITPYYDVMDGTLYFASNGHPSIGGFDIFKSKGARSNWETPENMGTPINSPADDFGFIKTSSGKGGFLVSNRTFGREKLTTTHEDIFEFKFLSPTRQWVAQGEVYNRSSGRQLSNVQIALYEILGTGQKRFITKILSEDGSYKFQVEPSKKYYIEAIKEGFAAGTYEFDTYDFATYNDFGAPIYLDPELMIGGAEPGSETKEKPAEPRTPPTRPDASKTPATGKVTSTTDAKPTTSTKTTATERATADTNTAAPTITTGFKIQVAAVSKFNPNDPRFLELKKFGDVETEYLPDRKLYRVLVSGYASEADASNVLRQIKSIKDFTGAFIVEYVGGKRVQ